MCFKCTKKRMCWNNYNWKSTIGRGLYTDLSEEIYTQLETTDNTIYKCFSDEKKKVMKLINILNVNQKDLKQDLED